MTRHLIVKMFNVGFGDCFLVEIPSGARACRILFDCGRHTGGAAGNQELADQVIAAVTDSAGKARIDLVVATHRHKDHVSGFAADGWDGVEVREVWMPWTEDRDDPKARGLALRQMTAAALAMKAFGSAVTLTGDQKRFAGLMELALTNEAAMATLYDGFSGDPKRRFLPDRQAPSQPLTLPGFPEIRFHVLGPTRNEATLGTMEPPKAETFRRLAAAEVGAVVDPLVPFPDRWTAPFGSLPLTDEERKQIARLATGPDLSALSAKIDNAINNTSLVIVVEIGTAFLLFCADAQWGNWQAILGNPDATELIRKTTFLKAGHHASHNASPVTLVQALLPKDIPVMVSVDPDAYSNVPYPGLLDAFAARGFKVARSDMPSNAGDFSGSTALTTLSVPF